MLFRPTRLLPLLLALTLPVSVPLLRASANTIAMAPACPATAANLLTEKWPASWIAAPSGSLFDYGVCFFRRTLRLEARPDRFVVHVSADNRYRLFVNGRSVGFGPERSDAWLMRYDSIDLAPYLHAGANVIAAEVVNYGAYRPAALVSHGTAFILQGDGPAAADVDTGPAWRVLRVGAYAPVPPDPSKIHGYYVAGPGDFVDGRSYPWGWTGSGYDDRTWSSPRLLGNGTPRYHGTDLVRWLAPRNIPMLPETLQRFQAVRRASGVAETSAFLQGRSPITVPAHTHATLLLDQGNETLAFPYLVVSGGRGARLTLAYAEALVDRDGRKGNRNDIEGRHLSGLEDRFITDGGDRRRFEPLDVRCYRYVELRVATEDAPLQIDDVAGMATGYPFYRNATFESDDPVLTRIWDVGWHTARLCAFETYMDCPYYERLQYLGDTRIQALISLAVSGDDRLMRNAIELGDRSRLPGGLTQSRSPSDPPQVIDTFSLSWVEMVHDYWMFRDDPAFVRARLPGIRAVLDWFDRHVDPKTGMLGPLPYWSFVDWAAQWHWDPKLDRGGEPPGAETGGSSIITLQYALALEHAADLFQAFGQTGEADRCRALAGSLREATLRLCWDPGRRLLADTPARSEFSQHANALAVLSGAVSGPAARDLMSRVIDDPSLVACTIYFRFYLLRAMRKAGLGDEYIAQLGPWRDMLAMGLTTFAETPEPSRSDCHAWSASPVCDLLETVCGIRPGSPGFRTVLIAPNLGPLQEARCTVPHPKGQISVAYQRTGTTLAVTIDLPPGLVGTFRWDGSTRALHPGHQVFKVRQNSGDPGGEKAL
ncbi:bacterial alpha-L-rhamnosidase [mine drainage metagenome]|uniref:Bacterial alpha-L-rhamnosidase n=1 Tax=mine drainage metagenome TaxID=410659 RepID=A0A1J5S646_9ZZZZ